MAQTVNDDPCNAACTCLFDLSCSSILHYVDYDPIQKLVDTSNNDGNRVHFGGILRVNRLDYQKTKIKITIPKDKNGFVVLEARPTGVGILEYKTPDGKVIRELRDEKEVFNPESMKTLALKPFSLMHRGRHLNSNTAKLFIKGTTGEEIRQDGDFLACKIALFDKDAIEGVEDGTTVELSPGYSCDIDPTPGEWRGQRYDQRQINIKYNHVSGVDSARKSGASFRFDSEDGEILISGFEETETMAVKIKYPSIDKGENLRFDSVEVDDTPETKLLVEQRDKAIEVAGNFKTKLSETEGRLDSTEKDLETEKKNKDGLYSADRLDSLVSEKEEVGILLKAAGKEFPKEGTYEEKIKAGKILLLGDNKRYDSDSAFLEGSWSHYAGDVKAKEKELQSKRNLKENKRTDSKTSETEKDPSEEV